MKSEVLPQSSKCLNYQALFQKRLTLATKKPEHRELTQRELHEYNAPIKAVRYRIARRRTVLSEAVTVPQKLQDHIETEYGSIDSMLLDEVADAVNLIYKKEQVARLRRTSTRHSITLFELHQVLFNLVFNYKPEN